MEPKGTAHGTPDCSASYAARGKRFSSIADVVDLEASSRRSDLERVGKLKRGEVGEEEFREGLREGVALIAEENRRRRK